MAATKRTSIGSGLSAPTRRTLRSSMTRRSLTCVVIGMSPTSSRKTVPPLADSSRPALADCAPVNEPFSCPNSSLSSSVSVSAAQLSRKNGIEARREFLCTASASRSLPTPVSPKMSTLMSLQAIRSTML